MYAEIAVNRPLYRTYTYEIPASLQVEIGQMVKVPFRTAYEAGIVVALTDEKPDFATKPILDLLDVRPVLTPVQVELGKWLAENTRAPLGFCLWLMLPPGITQKSDTLYHLAHEIENPSPAEAQLISLLKRRGARTGQQFTQAVGNSTWRKTIKNMVERGAIYAEPILAPPGVKPQLVRTAQLNIPPDQIEQIATELGRESKRANVLEVLWKAREPRLTIQEVLAAAGCGDSVIKSLAKNGDIALYPEIKSVELRLNHEQVRARIIELRGGQPYLDILHYLAAVEGADVSSIYRETETSLKHLEALHDDGLITLGESEIWRDSVAEKNYPQTFFPPLIADQIDIWEQIRASMENGHSDTFLLHGVTGSGKTEIYMQAAALAISQGRQAIIMVPEIALTTQMILRFAARFPNQVALVHSTLSPGERYDTWRRAREGTLKVAIGARSALFTPFPNVGVIILDEEHDDSYKQSPPLPPPYYHARETAIEYMRLNRGTVILGSATPDVISYYKAEQGIYQLLHLPDRILAHRDTIAEQTRHFHLNHANYRPLAGSEAAYLALPPVHTVDMRQELRVGHTSIFSRALTTALHEILAVGQQAILFLNRRGSATYVFCRECGYIAKCERCDTTLTYHRANEKLVCHRCGNRQDNPATCPSCNSRRIKYFGSGTEQIERTLQAEFPTAQVLRWDRDTASSHRSHEAIYNTFAERHADILVGTQMIAKGLDLPLVTLVGIISGDTALGLPDYRAGENTFQLLTQVAGRAGRGLLGGRVVLQTYQPEHYAIEAAAHHDYHRFYEQEIGFRRDLKYPPFTRLVRLLFTFKNEEMAQRQAALTAEKLERNIRKKYLAHTEIIGPVPCFFTRINGDCRWHLLVRTPDPLALFADFEPADGCRLDIDPVDIL